MADRFEFVDDPRAPRTRVIFHRGYHLELEPEYGGGFSQGEFLLRDDGVLFKRSVVRGHGPGLDGAGRWYLDRSWTGGPDAKALWEHLGRRGYEIDGDVYPIEEHRG